MTSLVAQMVKRLPTAQTWVPSLGWEDLLEKEMASISVALRKLLRGGRRRNPSIYKFATKGAESEHQKLL